MEESGSVIHEMMLCVLNDFNAHSMVFIDTDDIPTFMWSSPSFGISWNILNGNIRILENGYEVAFVQKNKIHNSDVLDSDVYDDILSHMTISLNSNENIRSFLNHRLNRLISSDNFEEATTIKKIIDIIDED